MRRPLNAPRKLSATYWARSNRRLHNRSLAVPPSRVASNITRNAADGGTDTGASAGVAVTISTQACRRSSTHLRQQAHQYLSRNRLLRTQ